MGKGDRGKGKQSKIKHSFWSCTSLLSQKSVVRDVVQTKLK